MRINQSLESDLPSGCISLTLLFSFFSKWQNTCSWPFKVATNDAIFPFLHRRKKFGIGERSEISRSLEVSRTTSTEPVNKDLEDNIALEETNKQFFSCSEVAHQGKYVGCVTPLSFSQASLKKAYMIIKISCQITTLLTKTFCLFQYYFFNHLENLSLLANRNIFHSWRASA